MAFLMYYNTGMANAFGAGSFSPLAYVVPVLYLVALSYLALSLFPFMSAEKLRKLVPVFVVLAALWSVWAGPTAAMMAFFYLLLWLRVYDLRRSTEKS
ncbi:MAG: hypothetical protein JNN07_07455 [Verrucomicrobiales bacterium]|nr:hypothetical protein [Verrucomicrobiales bacterium]